mgnify:CR=1 FL=1
MVVREAHANSRGGLVGLERVQLPGLVDADRVPHAVRHGVEAVDVLRNIEQIRLRQDGVAHRDIRVSHWVDIHVAAVDPHVDRVVESVNFGEIFPLEETVLLLLEEHLTGTLFKHGAHHHLANVFVEGLFVLALLLPSSKGNVAPFIMLGALVITGGEQVVLRFCVLMHPLRGLAFLKGSLSHNVKEIVKVNFLVHFFHVVFHRRVGVNHPVVFVVFKVAVTVGVPSDLVQMLLVPRVQILLVEHEIVCILRLDRLFLLEERVNRIMHLANFKLRNFARLNPSVLDFLVLTLHPGLALFLRKEVL